MRSGEGHWLTQCKGWSGRWHMRRLPLPPVALEPLGVDVHGHMRAATVRCVTPDRRDTQMHKRTRRHPGARRHDQSLAGRAGTHGGRRDTHVHERTRQHAGAKRRRHEHWLAGRVGGKAKSQAAARGCGTRWRARSARTRDAAKLAEGDGHFTVRGCAFLLPACLLSLADTPLAPPKAVQRPERESLYRRASRDIGHIDLQLCRNDPLVTIKTT